MQYDIVPHRLNKQKELLRTQFISKGTIPTEKLVKRMAQTGGHHPGQINGILKTLADTVLDFLEDGYVVQLGELGFLSVSLTSRLVESKKEIRAESVQFKKLNFRTGKLVHNRLAYAKTERVAKPNKRSSTLTREQRIQKLKAHFTDNPCITRAHYAFLTGLLKDKAVIDLNAFVKEGWLRRYGSGRTIVYLPNASIDE